LGSIKPNILQSRRIQTEQEATQIALETFHPENYIICNGKEIPIDWDSVVTFNDAEGFTLPKNCYKKAKTERIPTMFVTHWDVCLSSKSCFNILKKRGISVHFCIDNDGAIYQLMDCNDIGFHAGNWKVNTKSVGVEISNAYYPHYQDIYRRKGFGPRPFWRDAEVHGKKLKPFLGFYPVQVEAFKALAKALHKVYNIPLVAPMDGENLSKGVEPEVEQGLFKGVINHYHVTTRKIDCAGFELDKVLKEIT